ncbi:hypothetical protein ACTOB_008579 [Actinoplanes oblitus]|uniref:Uncharacterized protein n=1 Tax=Actinoplanes oblitus TaxID=3040509 RepID=A0ABY8WHM1_9ACTN|nr:hypothetical protein [Actinoplanes oblitus]WIM96387.1 hypothetical protein ACTOB_008579 [Actinoplanes oblitus]
MAEEADAPAAEESGGSSADDTGGQRNGKVAEPGDTKKMADVFNVFLGAVEAGTIGQQHGPAQRRTRLRSATGKIDDDEVRTDTEFFCRPESFDEALKRLSADHVVAIRGAMGIGKRTGAINLLRAVTTGQLVIMSSVSDLKELASLNYVKGHGYLIVDRVDGRAGGDIDFQWRTVRDQVRKAGAHLVVTTVTTASAQIDSVGHIDWSRPDVRTVSRAHLVDRDVPDEMLDVIAGHFDAECSMADVIATLRAIRKGVEPEVALDKLTETSARRVGEWFEAHRTDQSAILDVATVAFLGAVIYRDFDSLRLGLEACLKEHGAIAPPAAKSKKTDENGGQLLDRRSRLHSDEGLVCERRIAGPTSDRRVLVFRNDTYRRHVLAELTRRYETPFWNAIAQWLHSLVLNQPDAEVAIGLAELAAWDFDEVELAYLIPWSKGEIYTAGQTTAVFVLWAMCFRDETQPTALKVAKQWANHGDPSQRWAAAMAYSGILGACDPAQSIRQLWQLIFSSGQGFDEACYAMAVLFGTLLETGSAGKVLTTLDEQLRRPPRRPADRRITMCARQVLVEVLVMRQNRQQVPATFHYLVKYPKRLPLVARLWAEGICHRPHRQVVLQALWHGLNRLRHITDDPITFANALGEALVSALPPTEIGSFYEHLRIVDSRSANRTKPISSPARILLQVIGRHYRRKAS